MKLYILKYVLPGMGMIALAFFAGSQSNAILGLIGFLPLFTIGVLVIFHGWKRVKEENGNGP